LFGGECSFFKNQTAVTYFWRSGGPHIWMWENQYRSLYWYGSSGIYILQSFVNWFVLWHKTSWSHEWWYIYCTIWHLSYVIFTYLGLL
jgi:hypothetical protein